MYFPISEAPLARIFESTHSGSENPKHQEPHAPVTDVRTLPPNFLKQVIFHDSRSPLQSPGGGGQRGEKVVRESQKVREPCGQKLFGTLQNIKLFNPLILRMGKLCLREERTCSGSNTI